MAAPPPPARPTVEVPPALARPARQRVLEAALRRVVERIHESRGRIERDEWVKQAKALARGGVEEYRKVFGKDPR